MFKIGDFSKLAHLTVRALRHYEEVGVLQPKYIDQSTHYRYYTSDQIAEVNTIKLLQQMGFTLNEIKTVISSNDSDTLATFTSKRYEELMNEQHALNDKLTLIKVFQEQLQNHHSISPYHVSLKEIPPRIVMSLRSTLDSYEDEHQLWTKLFDATRILNVKLSSPIFGMTVYHDSEYKEHNVDIEVQTNVEHLYHDTDSIHFYESPGFLMASVLFNGSFDQMPKVTHAIASWIEANQYTMNGIMVHIPYVSPAHDSNPDNWITEAGYIIQR